MYLMQNLRSILIDSLVLGSGGVPAAGWELLYDAGGDTGAFVLGNEDGDFYVCFSPDQPYAAKVSIAATFEGVDAAGLIVGEAARSGNSASMSSPVFFSSMYFPNGYSSSNTYRGGWSMLADGNSVAFVWSASSSAFAPGSGLDSAANNIQRYGGGFGFGKTTTGVGVFCGASSSVSSYFHAHPSEGIQRFNHPNGLLIPAAEATSSVTAGHRAVYSMESNSSGEIDYISEDLPMFPMEVYAQGAGSVPGGSLGRLRGFVQLPHLRTDRFPRQILQSLGMAEDFGSMRLQDLSALRLGSDGNRYAYGKLSGGHTSYAQMFLTDNPAVW
ncbi:MAG: hypothetical protein ABGX82_08425 [Pseudomonas sp.]|uniref:hypothetical protein n=1 Tax=Pseudomonas sp. TaxID=306 RepID=UPI003242A632